ncbi:hypothetical protein AALA98_04495 [Lachnospiraceae bacterium 45-W7]
MRGKNFGDIRYNRLDFEVYTKSIAKCALEISGAETMDELIHALEKG